jgi:hypothetical protein
MPWKKQPESFAFPIFPAEFWDPGKQYNPVVKVTFERASDTFDSRNKRLVQALMSPLSIDALEASYNLWRRLEEKSPHRLFALIDFYIKEQINAIDEVENIIDEVREVRKITDFVHDSWFANESKLEPAKRIDCVESMIRKMSGVIGDPYADIFCEYFRVDRILTLGTQLVSKMRTAWAEMEEAWAAVRPINPHVEERAGFSHMLKKEDGYIPWQKLTESIKSSEEQNVKTLVFVWGKNDVPRLFMKMGQAWGLASFREGKGHWKLHLEKEEGEHLFRRNRRETVANTALLVSLFEDEAKPKRDYSSSKAPKRPRGNKM